MSVFVRALWGDEQVVRWSKTIKDIDDGLAAGLYNEQPRVTYAFGQTNFDLLEKNGFDPILIDEYPVPNSKKRDDRGWADEYSMWQLKVRSMEKAMESHDEILWLDWDAYCPMGTPSDFWARMRLGQHIQMPLVKFKRPFCYFREKDKRFVPEGAFIYCRDPSIVQQCKELYKEYPKEDDQALWARIIDARLPAEWRLSEDPYPVHYAANGYQPFCVDIYHKVFRPDEPIFRVRRGATHRRWLQAGKNYLPSERMRTT